MRTAELWFQSIGFCFNGIPSHDTIGRFFRLVDSQAFESCFVRWVQTLAENIQGVIAIDGKTICNAGDFFHGKKALHIVTAFAADNDIILGQLRTAEKSNEITAIPERLNTLSLKGDYVIGLKGN